MVTTMIKPKTEQNIKDLANTFLLDSVNGKSPMIDYLPTSLIWVDRRHGTNLTASEMCELLQAITKKLIHSVDLVLDNIDFSTMFEGYQTYGNYCAEWAYDEVYYVQHAIKKIINVKNYPFDVDTDLMKIEPSDFTVFVTLSDLEKTLLDLQVELFDVQPDLLKMTNFINGAFTGITIR